MYVDSEAYLNGVGSTGIAHGFGLYGSTNITHRRCKAHHNGRDGFDMGSTTNANNANAVYVDTVSHDNGEDGFGINSGPTGTVRADYINVIAFNNSNGWQIYDAAIANIYHSIAYHNGQGPSFGGNILTYSYNVPAARITLRNNIFFKPKNFAQIGGYTNTPSIIDSDYNIYVPRSSNSETAFEYPWGTNHTYSNPPSFVGTHDKVGLAYDPQFKALSTTNFAANDFHLKLGSVASNAGVFLTLPAGVTIDRDGVTRSNPPEIGLYEFIFSPNRRKDFNGDGKEDLLFRHPSSGGVHVWLMR